MTQPDDLTGPQDQTAEAPIAPAPEPTLIMPSPEPTLIMDNPPIASETEPVIPESLFCSQPQPDPPADLSQPSTDPAATQAAKKPKTWLIASIIVLAVMALIATLCLTVLRPVIFGYRGTPYCQTYIRVAGEMPNTSNRLSDAQAKGNLLVVQSALSEMIGQFRDLQQANPLEAVKPALDSAILYLSDLGEHAMADDPEGYNDYVAMHNRSFTTALTTINTETTAYCK